MFYAYVSFVILLPLFYILHILKIVEREAEKKN